MSYGRALTRGVAGAAATALKASPLGRLAGGISSLFGGGVDHRKRSLKALRRAAARGDWATVARKASQSKYKKVQGIASQLLMSQGDYKSAALAYKASKGPASQLGGAGPMGAFSGAVPQLLAGAGRLPGAPRRRASSTRRRSTARRAPARRRTRLKFGSRAWQLRYNPRYRRTRRRR